MNLASIGLQQSFCKISVLNGEVINKRDEYFCPPSVVGWSSLPGVVCILKSFNSLLTFVSKTLAGINSFKI